MDAFMASLRFKAKLRIGEVTLRQSDAHSEKLTIDVFSRDKEF